MTINIKKTMDYAPGDGLKLTGVADGHTMLLRTAPEQALEVGVAPSILSTGLVLHYDLNNSSCYSGSGTTVTDLKGSSNASLVNGVTYESNPGRLVFNGSNQYLLTSTSLQTRVPGDTTTISMWAYPMDNGVLLDELGVSQIPPNGIWHDAQMEMVSGVMKFSMWNHGSGIITSTVSTPLNAWYNFTLIYSAATSTMSAYVNGTLAGSVGRSRESPVENGRGLFYGIANADSTQMGDGSYASMKLGMFMVYNVALSAEQVQYNWNVTKGRFGL